MFNLNTIAIPQDSQLSSRTGEQENFPTVGLKSILQNSDLLELLLKPIANKSDDEKKMKGLQVQNCANPNAGLDTFVPELSDWNLDELLAPNKQTSDHDYEGCNSKLDTNDQEKAYKNAFLGPSSIWDKDEIFQSEKFGIEYLGIDEFLNENNLNEADIEFLDGLQNSDSLENNSMGSDSSHPTAPCASKVPSNTFLLSQVALSQKSKQIFLGLKFYKLINELLSP